MTREIGHFTSIFRLRRGPWTVSISIKMIAPWATSHKQPEIVYNLRNISANDSSTRIPTNMLYRHLCCFEWFLTKSSGESWFHRTLRLFAYCDGLAARAKLLYVETYVISIPALRGTYPALMCLRVSRGNRQNSGVDPRACALHVESDPLKKTRKGITCSTSGTCWGFFKSVRGKSGTCWEIRRCFSDMG